jgi:16S rRNA (guanine966-N2)-methyltransferase
MPQVHRNKSSRASFNQVRIIGGAWRRRTISFPDVEGLRPTPDRVRETLFNWLGQTMEGKTCLDLFSGSGALGFEALSREARQVVMVDRDTQVLRALKENARKLGVQKLEIIPGDGLEFLKRDQRKFDVIFLDPPFGLGLVQKALALLDRNLAVDGLVYVESEAPLGDVPAWDVWREGKAGNVYYGLLKRSEHADQNSVSGNV